MHAGHRSGPYRVRGSARYSPQRLYVRMADVGLVSGLTGFLHPNPVFFFVLSDDSAARQEVFKALPQDASATIVAES